MTPPDPVQPVELEPCPSCGALPCDWVDNHDELWYDDGFPGFDGPNMRERELAAEADLQAVLNAWLERHRDMLPGPTAFAWTAGGEWIDRPAQGIAAPSGGETGTGSTEGKSPVGFADAPKGEPHDQ